MESGMRLEGLTNGYYFGLIDMRLSILTICLDAAEFLPRQLAIFEQLRCDWHWFIAEGTAAPVKDTAWCKAIPPRLSRDGTSELLTSWLKHPRITIFRRQLWQGKVEMCNKCLSAIKEPCALLEVDADEFWQPSQIEKIVQLYETGQYDRMRFFCRYFVGPNIIVKGEDVWSNKPGEWSRSWLFNPTMRFLTHEPPNLKGCGTRELTREQTRELGLVFDHFAYCSEKTLQFKMAYYGYKDAVAHWRRLQENKVWPVTSLKDWLPWVGEGATADWIENTL